MIDAQGAGILVIAIMVCIALLSLVVEFI